MRLAVPFAALLLALPACAGGPDAAKARELLARADAAQAQVTTIAYTGNTKFSVGGQEFGFSLTGAAVLKGDGAGDQWLRMTGEGVPGVGTIAMTMVKRGDRIVLDSMGQRQELAVPTELKSDAAWGSLGAMSLERCVKDVDVAEGRSLNGEPATRVAGVIDTGCAFEAISSVSGFGQAGAPALDRIRESLGDARATLFISDRSQLLIGGVISLTADLEGTKAEFEISYRVTDVDGPVRFPA